MGYREEKDDSNHTKDELEYLELRQRLKTAFRKETRKESCTVLGQPHQNKKLHQDNYGSFFGPSETVIAQRVIEESKAILEIQHSSYKSKTRPALLDSEANLGLLEMKLKAQMLRETRDYSFLLSSNAQLPACTRKESPPKRVLKSNPAQLPSESKLSMNSNSRKVLKKVDERKHVSTAHHLQPSSRCNDVSSKKWPRFTSTDSRKPLGSNTANVVCQPAVQKGSLDRASKKSPIASHGLNASSLIKSKCATKGNLKQEEKFHELGKGNAMLKHQHPHGHQPTFSKSQRLETKSEDKKGKVKSQLLAKQHLEKEECNNRVNSKQSLSENNGSDRHKASSATKQHVERKKEIEYPDKAKTTQNHLQTPSKHQRKRPFQEDSDEDDCDVSSIIRRLFGRNDRDLEGVEDDDNDIIMESSFDDILKEERRSATAARKEDERERLLIEEEARNEQLIRGKKGQLQLFSCIY